MAAAKAETKGQFNARLSKAREGMVTKQGPGKKGTKAAMMKIINKNGGSKNPTRARKEQAALKRQGSVSKKDPGLKNAGSAQRYAKVSRLSSDGKH